jgi:hypothetical protein
VPRCAQRHAWLREELASLAAAPVRAASQPFLPGSPVPDALLAAPLGAAAAVPVRCLHVQSLSCPLWRHALTCTRVRTVAVIDACATRCTALRKDGPHPQ